MLQFNHDVPKGFIPSEDFEYDFAKAKHSHDVSDYRELMKCLDKNTVVEEKFDGSRFGFVKGPRGNRLLSRNAICRLSNVPYIAKSLDDVFGLGTILDGEVIHPLEDHKVRWELCRSVMGSKDFRPELPQAHYLIFDAQFFNGTNLRRLPMATRYSIVLNHLKDTLGEPQEGPTFFYWNNHLAMPKQFGLDQFDSLWDLIVTRGGGEGLMAKHLNEEYAASWTKIKESFTIDAFVSGIEKGQGKYSGQIGALVLSVYKGTQVVEIGKASGMTDAERKEFTRLALENKLKNITVEVKANEVTKNGKLRHPRFLRLRNDKLAIECTFDQLEQQLNKE